MIVSAHQPNFAPWLGFFDKMLHSDVLVFLDTVQFTKRGYQNRTQVKGSNGAQWLTVPVISKGRYYQTTREVEIDESSDWRRVHLRTLRTLLAKAPHRDELLASVEPIYARTDLRNLADLNIALIRVLTSGLGISTRMVRASELACDGQSTELMLNLATAVGGDIYLSGPTGRNYLEPALFTTAGVTLRYHRFEAFEYPQLFGPFTPGLSCFDYVANAGFSPWRRPTDRAE